MKYGNPKSRLFIHFWDTKKKTISSDLSTCGKTNHRYYVFGGLCLGGIERKHRDLKLNLIASLHQMADESRSQWMSRLPWVMLGRLAFQPELNATATELVFRSNPLLPGDIVGEPGPPLNRTQLETLLEASNWMQPNQGSRHPATEHRRSTCQDT